MFTPRYVFQKAIQNYSTAAIPKTQPLIEIFPKAKTVKRLLFELDSPFTYKQLFPVYQDLYISLNSDALHNGTPVTYPKNFNGGSMMLMKKVLERIRFKNKSTNQILLKLENRILYQASRLGDNDAIAILSFDTLNNDGSNAQEKQYAKDLIKQLYEIDHPLTFKLTADMMFKSEQFQQAKQYYEKYLKFDKNEKYVESEVYGKLGEIFLKLSSVDSAEECFLKSIRLAPLQYSIFSYFHLSQIYINSQQEKARKLLEACASEGFKESFALLGFLESNHFKNYEKAKLWFQLGMEIMEIDCYMGYMNCCISTKDWDNALNVFNSLKQIEPTIKSEPLKQLVYKFYELKDKELKECISNEYFA